MRDAASSSASASSQVADLIARLRVQAGTANGTDCSEAQRAVVGGILKDIESFNTDDAPARVDLTGRVAFTRVSDWLHGPRWLSSTECVLTRDVTPGGVSD
jgi:hypothetical protein